MSKYSHFLTTNNLKQIEIVRLLGISKPFMSQLVHGTANLSSEKLDELIRLSEENGWDYSMLTNPVNISANASNNSSANVNIGSNVNYPSTPAPAPKAEAKVNTIPLIPMDAHAGSLADYADSAMEYQCERFVSPIAGASCAIRIAGESMAPEYPNGSIAILKKVNEKAFIEWGKVYVLDTENGAIIKEIRKTEEKGVIECVSLNPDPKYQPFEVETDYINGWYRVLMVMAIK